MSSVDEHRRQAIHYLQMAERASDPATALSLRQLAQDQFLLAAVASERQQQEAQPGHEDIRPVDDEAADR